MRLYKGVAELESPPKYAVVTIGNFDGVHLGHQQLLRAVKQHAARVDGTAVAITFRPHPHFVLRPTAAPHLINSYEEKLELLGSYGADFVIEEPFSREFSNISPPEFVNRILVERLATKVLYLGYDFAFGKERAGSVNSIRPLVEALGIEMHVVPPYQVNGQTVSSSLIRSRLDSGEIETANLCLGRPFFLRGLVWRGEGRGRTIGVPTANLRTENRKYPKVGVYASRTLWRGKWYGSVSNVGFNPTFKGDGTDLPLKVETHLFDFDADMYGDEIQVEFFSFLRTERKFPGVGELLEQIHKDIASARAKLAALGR
ncbi:MAG TPA: bifunctional riboflavin kinase/FAD synthetase [Bdellovibrionota bacterium]|jgi:riboflavin kinase/FMN adenylyltransferase